MTGGADTRGEEGVESRGGKEEPKSTPGEVYTIEHIKRRVEDQDTSKKKAETSLLWREKAKPLPERPGRRQITQGSGGSHEPAPVVRQPCTDPTPSTWIRKPSIGGGNPEYEPYGERQTNEFYAPGVVISTFHHITPNITTNMQQTEDLFLSPRRQWIMSKRRKLIIVERYVSHCITIPIYTYGKKGLAEKNRLTNEYIGVFDSSDTGNHKSQSPENGYVLGTRAPAFSTVDKDNFHFFNGLSHAHLTNPVCFDYATPSIHEGNITPEGTKKLLLEYYKCRPNEGGPRKGKKGNKAKEVEKFEENK